MTDLRSQISFHEDKKIESEGIDGLHWVDGDSGSWDGPHTDWLTHRERILSHVDRHDVVVQAGGNLGLYPKLLSKRFGHVYTFEPLPLNFACLSLNVMDDNVVKINSALSNQNELVEMNVKAPSNLGMTTIERNRTTASVPAFTIDQLALRSCDLIWLDIEGSEYEALLGARWTITTFSPVIAIETVNQSILNYLGSFGYDKVDQSISDAVFKKKS